MLPGYMRIDTYYGMGLCHILFFALKINLITKSTMHSLLVKIEPSYKCVLQQANRVWRRRCASLLSHLKLFVFTGNTVVDELRGRDEHQRVVTAVDHQDGEMYPTHLSSEGVDGTDHRHGPLGLHLAMVDQWIIIVHLHLHK